MKNKTEIPRITLATNFVDNFNSLNLKSLWSHDIYIPQEPVCIQPHKLNILYRYYN